MVEPVLEFGRYHQAEQFCSTHDTKREDLGLMFTQAGTTTKRQKRKRRRRRPGDIDTLVQLGFSHGAGLAPGTTAVGAPTAGSTGSRRTQWPTLPPAPQARALLDVLDRTRTPGAQGPVDRAVLGEPGPAHERGAKGSSRTAGQETTGVVADGAAGRGHECLLIMLVAPPLRGSLVVWAVCLLVFGQRESSQLKAEQSHKTLKRQRKQDSQSNAPCAVSMQSCRGVH